MEVNLPGGQYQEKDPESADSAIQAHDELELILLLERVFQPPDLQPAKKNEFKRGKGQG